MPNSKLDLVVAGTADAVLMVESEAQELSEDVMLGAVMFGHREMQPVIDAIIRLAEKAAKEPRDVPVDDNKRRSSRASEAVRRRRSGAALSRFRKSIARRDAHQGNPRQGGGGIRRRRRTARSSKLNRI